MTDVSMQAWLDQDDASITETVRRYGWFVEYVVDDTPFAYTVGLFGLHHPELLIFGVPPATAAAVLNELGDGIRAGHDLLPGTMITLASWPHRIVPEPVPNPGEIVFAANRYYGHQDEASVPVLQLSYDDEAGRFPWDPGHAAPARQPRPGEFRA